MELRVEPFGLRLTRRWTIASRTGPGGGAGTDEFPVAFVQLRASDGRVGWGESAPSDRYRETLDTVTAAIRRVDPARLSFEDLHASLGYLDTILGDQPAARCGVEIALLDGAARAAGQPIHNWLGLPFTEGRHVTSFSIGLDTPEMIQAKVLEAAEYPVLKLKLGGDRDRENLAALRAVAPKKCVRVDANEAWKTREEALQNLTWLAADASVEFVEQPMPAGLPRADWEWLYARTPLPLMADESYRSAADLPRVLGCFHAVNVKLVKTGGILPAMEALHAARQCGLKTMLGCMIESSVLISAAAQLADLTDYLDLDGNLLTSNDPFRGPTAPIGQFSFAHALVPAGLRVDRGPGSPF